MERPGAMTVDPTYADVVQLLATYAAIVDAGDGTPGPTSSSTTAAIASSPRENHDRGPPLATPAFESRALLPTPALRHPRDPVSMIPTTSATSLGRRLIRAREARPHPHRDQLRRLSHQAVQADHHLHVGRYLDEIVATPTGLKFRHAPGHLTQ